MTSSKRLCGRVHHILVAVIVPSGLLLAVPAHAASPKRRTAPFAGDSTYAQRVAASPRNQALKVDSLVLPHPHAMNVMPAPALWKAGQKLRRYRDADVILWQSVPIKKGHAEYLKKRAELIAAKQEMTLVSWCERNALPACAEFELRRMLFNRGDIRSSSYKAALWRWLKYGDRRQIAASFPLPVEGEWYVAVDRTKHHRAKHGAAYAWDLLIKRNGTFFKGNVRRMEDHYAWGQRIIAQADGVVVHAEGKHPDVPIGKLGAFANANDVVIDYGGAIRVLYGHLQQNSVRVKVGQRVKAGQWIGNVGNSGASGMPHLHVSFLDGAHFSIKGRYRCQVLSGRRWIPHDGRDLRGGTYVRNIPAANAP